MSKSFRVPRSRASQTHREMRAEIIAALEPILFDAYRHSYPLRRQLEDAFAAEVQKRYAVAVHSGTVALVIALRACDIGPGDEVITVGNSDISTSGAISLCGAAPVLCDVLESDYTLDIATVAAQITERTRAILPVDLHGHPADVKGLRALADRYKLKIVEDAALAVGAFDHGRPVSAFADVAMFSFAPFKPLGSAGNGAMLVTDDEAIDAQMRLLVGYGQEPAPTQNPSPIKREVLQNALAPLPSLWDARHRDGGKGPGDGGWPSAYQDYVAEGFNVPLDGLQAALLLVKLPRLKEWTARRRAIASALESGLRDTPVITPRFRPESAPTFRSYAVRVVGRHGDQQLELHEGLREAGIETVIHYAPPVYRYQVYADAFPNREQLPVTEMLSRQVVNLPVTPELTDVEVEYMIDMAQQLLGVK